MNSKIKNIVILLVVLILAFGISGCVTFGSLTRLLNDFNSIGYDEARDTVAERQQATEDINELNAVIEQMQKSLKETEPLPAQ